MQLQKHIAKLASISNVRTVYTPGVGWRVIATLPLTADFPVLLYCGKA